jgi:hypothetical protein
MVQSNIDDKFLNGLHLMIDSIESSYLEKDGDRDDEYHTEWEDVPENLPSDTLERVSHNGDKEHLPVNGVPEGAARHIQNADENDLPEADHWCPDVQAWHTADHEPAQAPSVHVNVDNDNGDDSDQSENTDIEKIGILATAVRAAAPAVGQAVGEKIGSKIKGEGVAKTSVAATLKDVEHGRDRIESEYDQNTNLDRQEQENSPDSIAEPFLNRYAVRDDEEEEEENGNEVKKSNEFIESLVTTHAKSIDILKIWGSVDRVLPKTSSDITLINDIDILKSFNLDETTNIEDLIKGTLVHKMLVDRTSRPTVDWWESSMLMAKSIDVISEPAFFSAFLYYEPDTFDITDFVEIEKAEVTRGKPQDLEMMPNTSGGSAIDGLGMSADGIEPGPEDDDCDD